MFLSTWQQFSAAEVPCTSSTSQPSPLLLWMCLLSQVGGCGCRRDTGWGSWRLEWNWSEQNKHFYLVSWMSTKNNNKFWYIILGALSLNAYIALGKESKFRRSIMLSRRRVIEEPKCCSGKCLVFMFSIKLFEKQTRIIYKGNLTKGTQLCKSQSLWWMWASGWWRNRRLVHRSVVNARDTKLGTTAFRMDATSLLTVLPSPGTILLRWSDALLWLDNSGWTVDSGHHPLNALHSKGCVRPVRGSNVLGCIFFPKIDFFINHYLEHWVFYK